MTICQLQCLKSFFFFFSQCKTQVNPTFYFRASGPTHTSLFQAPRETRKGEGEGTGYTHTLSYIVFVQADFVQYCSCSNEKSHKTMEDALKLDMLKYASASENVLTGLLRELIGPSHANF